MGLQVLQSAESAVAAYSAVVDLEAANPHRRCQSAIRQVLEVHGVTGGRTSSGTGR